ncbi:hypothetical protein CQ047_06295 [Microbacterium sp. MYb72]|uniref:hypothetical protein n=1 Tax=Microbacterium sp. MYb72 TaxID=1848693 RepID=UPI000CFAC1E5|nr:hypothetical protein [Microbacterium sp. MYb72]PRB10713.1 hypothetical protein CQ047_06295 [Microbacterium sp. MYb72]
MHESRKPAVLRGFAASSLAIFAALAGHLTGGGTMPGPLGILVPWLLSLMVCVLLAGRRLSVVRLSLSVAISQLLFHVLFVLGTITPTGAVGGHVHGAPLQLSPTDGLSAAVAADGLMWFGHAIAAVVTILALHRGERLLLGLRERAELSIRWLRRRVDALVAMPAPPRPLAAPASDEPEALRDLALRSPLHGRAPPAPTAV